MIASHQHHRLTAVTAFACWLALMSAANGQTLAVRSDLFGDPLPAEAIARLGSVRLIHGGRLNAMHFTPDGKTLVSLGSGFIRLWDAVSGKEIKHIATTASNSVDPTTLLPDGKTLVRLSRETLDTVRTYDLDLAKEIRAVSLPTLRSIGSVNAYALSPDGRLCTVRMLAKYISIFDTATAKELYQLANEDNRDRALTFAGNDWLVVADKEQMIRVYEARTGKLLREFNHGAPAQVLVSSPDGALLAVLEHHTSGIDRLLDKDTIHLWDLKTGVRKHTLFAPPQSWYMAPSSHPTASGSSPRPTAEQNQAS